MFFSGADLGPAGTRSIGSADVQIHGENDGDKMGHSTHWVGDVDGDGDGDFLGYEALTGQALPFDSRMRVPADTLLATDRSAQAFVTKSFEARLQSDYDGPLNFSWSRRTTIFPVGSTHKANMSNNVKCYYVTTHCKILSLKADFVSGTTPQQK